MGHEASDALIKEAACIINESFGKFGKAFRVDWGRFCVLIDSDSDYNTAKEQFEKLVEISNAENSNHLEIRISHGFCHSNM